MSDSKQRYLAIVYRANGIWQGYALDYYPEEEARYRAECRAHNQTILGSFDSASEAQAAVMAHLTVRGLAAGQRPDFSLRMRMRTRSS